MQSGLVDGGPGEVEARLAGAMDILREAIIERAFPGAVAAVAEDQKVATAEAAGRFTYDPDSPMVTVKTVFDLASLTKVVATTAMAMILFERGTLPLDSPVVEFLPEFCAQPGTDNRRRARVTFRMLLSHSSGLPAYVRLFEVARNREELLGLAFQTPLEADPSARCVYSDIGFIILGEILTRIAGEGIDTFCHREIFAPLGMQHTRYCPPPEWKLEIPPTVDDREFRKRVIQGEVHDENASVMGGISGHAGLFSTAQDLIRFGQCILRGGAPILKPETVSLFTHRASSPPGSTYALGWDTPGSPSQSGRHFSPYSFGHLGYTGTSIWVDGNRKVIIVLLSNRTWPNRQSQAIKQIRPRFHDTLMLYTQNSS